MNPFRRAWTLVMKNPGFLIAAFCLNLAATAANKLLFPQVKNIYLAAAFAVLDALVLLVTLTLAVDVHRERAFSLGALSHLPRSTPLFLLCYAALSAAALSALVLMQRASVLIALMEVSFALCIVVPLLVIVLAYFTLLWLELYAALCANGVPHALEKAFKMLKHPFSMIGLFFKFSWPALLILYASSLLAAIPVAGVYISVVVNALLTPFTALLTLAWCDALCQRYAPRLPRF